MEDTSCASSVVAGLPDSDSVNTHIPLPANVESSVNLHPEPMSFQPESQMLQNERTNAFKTLSASLGAHGFTESSRQLKLTEASSTDEVYVDAKSTLDETFQQKSINSNGRIWINAAMGIDYNGIPLSSKYTRYVNVANDVIRRSLTV